MARAMRTGNAGLDLVKRSESLVLKAYLCPAHVWTIGYGHTRGVKMGDTCTEEQAIDWLKEDLRDAEAIVDATVDVPLSQNQFDALVSFVFNVGGGAFKTSTLLRLLNRGEYSRAAEQLDRWNKAAGQVLAGLTTRRAAERALFETGA
jgi:lysozyme